MEESFLAIAATVRQLTEAFSVLKDCPVANKTVIYFILKLCLLFY
jgi:hypothetical protein